MGWFNVLQSLDIYITLLIKLNSVLNKFKEHLEVFKEIFHQNHFLVGECLLQTTQNMKAVGYKMQKQIQEKKTTIRLLVLSLVHSLNV